MFGWKKKKNNDEATTHEKTQAGQPGESAVGDLKVKVKERGACSIAMTVEVPADRVAQQTEESFRRVQSKVKHPGFRPGKAPLEIIKKNYHGAAWEDAVDQLLRESVFDALTKEKVAGISTPVVDKIQSEPGKPLRFELKVECAPEVRLKDYRGLPLHRTGAPVQESDVDKQLNDLLETHAKLNLSKDAVVEKKHFVVVDYECLLDGKPVANGKASQQLVEMSAEQNVSGFTEGLLGSKEGETREIPVTFPAEHPQKDLAGKSVTFKTTVTALKEKVLPLLDDDFAKDLGATDLATLRENVRRELETNRRRTERKDLEKQVIDELLQRNVFEVPASQVRDRAHQLTQQLRQFLKERGANDSDWAANETKMLEKNRPEAERQVRLSYILGQILETEKLTVADADVEAHIQKILGGAPAAQRKEIEEWMASRRENVRAQMREERLFDFLITNGKMTDGLPSATPS